MDGVQLPQGHTATTKRQFPFYQRVPRITGTHLIYFRRMKNLYIHFCKSSKALSISRSLAKCFLKAVYVARLKKHFEIYGVQIIRKCIWDSGKFSYALRQNSPQVNIITPTQI